MKPRTPTVSVRCTAEVKAEILEAARAKGMSASKYVPWLRKSHAELVEACAALCGEIELSGMAWQSSKAWQKGNAALAVAREGRK